MRGFIPSPTPLPLRVFALLATALFAGGVACENGTTKADLPLYMPTDAGGGNAFTSDSGVDSGDAGHDAAPADAPADVTDGASASDAPSDAIVDAPKDATGG